MHRTSRFLGWLAALLLLFPAAAVYAAGSLEVLQARVRLIPGGGPQAGYFTIVNHGPASVRLIGVSSPAFGRVMMHRSVVEGGMARMQALPDGVTVPAGGRVEFAPEGLHLMLMDARMALRVGQHVPIALHFAQGPPLRVDFAVVPLDLD